MANVSSSNGLEKRPKLRFPGFDEPLEHKELLHYLVENTARNKQLKFGKENVLSVSGEYGIVNQIAFQGRSFAGESVADYHVVETDDIVYTKSPLKANPYGIIKVNNGVPGIVSTLYAVYHPLKTVVPRFVDFYFSNNLRINKFLKPLVNIGAKHDMKVNNTFVLTGTVVFPPLREQQKIVDFLTVLDRRIDIQRKKVEALKKYKRGV
ncbi:MAG: restriction endonuclease subunit S, partial [Intestinimonas butyriciproducens]|uniref:restriction endonuclease subunit S n=1 Tax=Intestinimonas butyriciproducens TaxID=1297617 RepID=UPI003991F116